MDLVLVTIMNKLEDPRIHGRTSYPLNEIILVAFATILCGGEGYADMKLFGESKLKFFKTLLPFENGIPSEDTFERVFKIINPKEFQKCFMEWISYLKKIGQKVKDADTEIVSIDGKNLLLSENRTQQVKPLNLVNSWASANRCVLGCHAVESKANEITAIPEVLKLLSLKGTVVTIDAIGCQKHIVDQIIEQNSDFVIALKGNQGNLHDEVKTFFKMEEKNDFKNVVVQQTTTSEKDHGRFEKREYIMYSNVDWLKQRNPCWDSIRSIGLVRAKRVTNNATTEETRYYISSLENNIELFAKAVRMHWGVENSLHWRLDVVFREDDCRVRDRNAAENLGIMRRCAVSIFANEPSKISQRGRRLKAGWDHHYLKKLLFQTF